VAKQDHYLKDFNQWATLAETDPTAFESMRRDLIERLIESAPEERRLRLRRLQWRIDQERALAKSPLGACIRLSRMMWDRLLGDDGLLEQLQRVGTEREYRQPRARSARILAFRPRPE
jgi:hypothetical protein